MKTVRRLEPILWRQGTRLTPHHLQQQDRYIEDTSRFAWSAARFRPWGFRTLRIDREALAGGVLAVSSAAGILSEGLLFDMPGSDATPEPLPLAGCFGPDDTACDFSLALPYHRDRGANLASRRVEGDARYRASMELFRDENTGVSEKAVQIARRRFRLVKEEDARQGVAALRIARVRLSPGGVYELDRSFVPPLLDLAASDYLVSIARRLVEILSARSSSIAATRRHRGQTLGDFTTADIPDFWLLYTINTWLPAFRHLFESGAGHPEKLFSAMTGLAGALTTFSSRATPRELPCYDHESLEKCFSELDAKLRFLLETVAPRNWVSLPLKLARPSIYTVSIDDERCLAATQIYLAIRSEEASRVQKTPRLVKVSSFNQIEHLVRQALPGVALTHVPQPPGAAPVKLGFEYFALDTRGAAWDAVAQSRRLAAYVPAELASPELELIALSASESGK
jgi:type VI secretion system protein ImpJ